MQKKGMGKPSNSSENLERRPPSGPGEESVQTHWSCDIRTNNHERSIALPVNRSHARMGCAGKVIIETMCALAKTAAASSDRKVTTVGSVECRSRISAPPRPRRGGGLMTSRKNRQSEKHVGKNPLLSSPMSDQSEK